MVRTKARFDSSISKLEEINSNVSLRAALEGIVLLENNGALPLKKMKVALYGAGASTTIKGGTGSGEVNERHVISILEGLEMEGFEVTTKDYLEEYERLLVDSKHNHNKGFIKRVIVNGPANLMGEGFNYPTGRLINIDDIKKSDTDTAIYVVARQAGESSDRQLSTFSFDETEISNLNFLIKSYQKVILVINVGGVMDLSSLDDMKGIDSVIFFAQQGQMGGLALAKILKGEVSPSGALTDTWPKSYNDIPFGNEFSYLKGNDRKEYYKEDIYVGYRYFDSFNIDSRYEFGYGLSYASFDISFVEFYHNKSLVTVKVKVKNTSDKYSGKKIVQLYMSTPNNKYSREYQMIVGYEKSKELKPNEEEILDISFDLSDFALYDESLSSFVLEEGAYVLRLGSSSKDNFSCGCLYLASDVLVEKCKNICPINEKIDVLVGPKFHHEYSELKTLLFTELDFVMREYSYNEYNLTPLCEVVYKFKEKELIDLVVGSGMFFGKKYFEAFGCAGFTTSKLIEKGYCNLGLADGPAGLRLQKRTSYRKNGSTKPIDAMMEFMNYFPKFVKKFMFGNEKKDKILYQYTTSFPVGIALAQTFNKNLLTEVGKAIADEMIEYGVTFWLAPGMNIHRNPLCGRNYEYYSEDPVVTGMTAASIIKGIQSYEGLYATIKHFAANNREFLRNTSDSILTERALREIYLKGFKFAVKYGNAKSVMTSYNLVNGIYTPNSYDLCTNVLRCEWGFEGVVMTDWLSTGRNLGSNGLAIKAGNDLIMPGGKYYKKQIKKSLRKGELSYESLLKCASNILNAINNSEIQKQYINKELNEDMIFLDKKLGNK